MGGIFAISPIGGKRLPIYAARIMPRFSVAFRSASLLADDGFFRSGHGLAGR